MIPLLSLLIQLVVNWTCQQLQDIEKYESDHNINQQETSLPLQTKFPGINQDNANNAISSGQPETGKLEPKEIKTESTTEKNNAPVGTGKYKIVENDDKIVLNYTAIENIKVSVE